MKTLTILYPGMIALLCAIPPLWLYLHPHHCQSRICSWTRRKTAPRQHCRPIGFVSHLWNKKNQMIYRCSVLFCFFFEQPLLIPLSLGLPTPLSMVPTAALVSGLSVVSPGGIPVPTVTAVLPTVPISV